MIFNFLGLGAKSPQNPETQESSGLDSQGQASGIVEKEPKELGVKPEIAWDRIAAEAPQIPKAEPLTLDEVRSEAVIEEVEAFMESPAPNKAPEVVVPKIEVAEEKKSPAQNTQTLSIDVESSTELVSPPQVPDTAAPEPDFKADAIVERPRISEASTYAPDSSAPATNRAIQDAAPQTPITQMSGMNCAPEDVIGAYKIFLGRLPENMQVIQPWVSAPSEKLLIDFMVSNEFLSNPDRVKFVVNLAKKIIEAHAANQSKDEVDPSKELATETPTFTAQDKIE